MTFMARYREKDGVEQCVWEHLHNVADLSGEFSKKLGLSEAGELLGLLHDLGKGTKEFDDYIRSVIGTPEGSSTKNKVDHSTAGAQYVYELLSKDIGQPSYVSEILFEVVAMHHGITDCLTPDGKDLLTTRINKDDALTRKQEALINLDQSIFDRITKLNTGDIEEEILGFIKAVYESNDTIDEINFKIGLLLRFLLSCLIDADRLDASDFEYPSNKKIRQYSSYVPWSELIEGLEKKIKKFKITTPIDYLRRDISEKCLKIADQEKGIYRLTVPTGGGKTLSSLRFALHHAKKHSMDRIVYVIPYTSIIDQNAKRIREIFNLDSQADEGSIVLEHHSNLAPELDNEKTKLLAGNWDSPIILTTMVQFLETLFSSKTNSCRRMHQLANSVIIFDEIQTLPVNCVHMFNLAVKFLVKGCGSTIMLCTATQPLLHQVTPLSRALPFEEEKEITPMQSQTLESLERVDVIDITKPEGWCAKDIAELAVEELTSKGVLIIVNTKKAAASIFNNLQALTSANIFHLSTNMCPAHRLDILEEVHNHLSKSKPVICVSTQLIEAGVDIDFGVVIRSLAGLDSIAQAAGRCNRHASLQQKGRVLLINPQEENLNRLPDINKGKQVTQRLLGEFANNKEHEHLLSREMLERYFLYYFHERSNEMAYPVSRSSAPEVNRNDNLFDLLATNEKSVAAYRVSNQRRPPNILVRQSFASAAKAFRVIQNVGQGIIVPYGQEGEELIADLSSAYELKKQFKLLRKAQRYSVNCFPHVLEELATNQAIYEVQKGNGIYALRTEYYNCKMGLMANSTRLMNTIMIDS